MDKVAIVTGGATGIGEGYVKGLCSEGARVAIADINLVAAQKTAKEIQDSGGRAIAVSTDVSDEANTLEMAKRTHRAFGRIDILVNNAALMSALEHYPWDGIPVGEWDRVMAVNVRGMWLCCRAVYPYMKAQGTGKIINISSSAVHGASIPGWMHYVTSKGAVIAFTRALARELGSGNINVNAVTPGLTETDAIKGIYTRSYPGSLEEAVKIRSIKRRELPEDLVGTIIFLASADSDFITGQTINVDGGRFMP